MNTIRVVRRRKKLNLAALRSMTEAEIAALPWPEVAAALSADRPPAPEPWIDPDAPAPLAMQDIRSMSTDQINTHWDRVKATLEANQPGKGSL